MNSYIKGIVVFKDATKEGKRVLELSQGLNIITGHSKTGKSAILDIIDWCLGAKECTIPQGVITQFANLYALLILFNNQNILLARRDGIKGKNYLFVDRVSEEVSINDISLNYFSEDKFIKLKDAFEEINKIINIGLGENKLLDIDFKIPNVTIRSALSFNFQHQDIISSNSRLFYIDPIKNHFPILAGWFDSEYYIVLESIDKLQKALNRLNKENSTAKTENAKLEFNVKDSLRTYYNLIGIEFNNEWSIKDCLNRIKNLEEFKKQEYSNNLIKRQEELEPIIERHQTNILQLNRKISKLNIQKKEGAGYKTLVEQYQKRASYFSIQPEYTCPICNKQNEVLSTEALNIIEADIKLRQELEKIPSQTSKFDFEISETQKKKDELKKALGVYKKEFEKNLTLLNKIGKEKNLNEQKQKARWKVFSDMEIYKDRKLETFDKTIDSHLANLKILKERKRTYNENERYERAKIEIEEKMSLIVELLDFEHKPPELFFELNPQKEDAYRLYHNNAGQERVFLRQIGSASNALACHLGMFLSFLHYFSKQENSKVPTILFFDQPSQVYFPSGTDNNDIEKVGQIYETILNQIENIEAETGFAPQIIVADHIKDLGEETVKLYGHYFKADWRNGKGFI
jgi:hypothetical protein